MTIGKLLAGFVCRVREVLFSSHPLLCSFLLSLTLPSAPHTLLLSSHHIHALYLLPKDHTSPPNPLSYHYIHSFLDYSPMAQIAIEPHLTDALPSMSCSSQSSILPSPPLSIHSSAADMKDVSNSTKASRPTAYPKKRPSPYGVAKSSRKYSPLYASQSLVRKTPRATKAEFAARRQRETNIAMMRREGIYLEEEYREEIRIYMHDMEVSHRCFQI